MASILETIIFYPKLDFKSNLEKNGITHNNLQKSYEEWHAQAVLEGLGEENAQKGGGIIAILTAIILMTGVVANPNPRPEFTLIPTLTTSETPSLSPSPSPVNTSVFVSKPSVFPSPSYAPSTTVTAFHTVNAKPSNNRNTTVDPEYSPPEHIKPSSASLMPSPSQSPSNSPWSTPGFERPTPRVSNMPSNKLANQTPSVSNAMYDEIAKMAGSLVVGLALGGVAIPTLWKKSGGESATITEQEKVIQRLEAEIIKKKKLIKELADALRESETCMKTIKTAIGSSRAQRGGSKPSDEMIARIVRITGGPPRSAKIVQNTLNSKQSGGKTRRRNKKLN